MQGRTIGTLIRPYHILLVEQINPLEHRPDLSNCYSLKQSMEPIRRKLVVVGQDTSGKVRVFLVLVLFSTRRLSLTCYAPADLPVNGVRSG